MTFALAAAYLYIEEKQLELRVDALSAEGFTFRTLETLPVGDAAKDCRLELLLYHGAENRYEHLQFAAPAISLCEEGEEGYVYRVSVDDMQFRQEVDRFWQEYSQYVKLKTEESDGELSRVLTGYPAEQDEKFPADFRSQKLDWYATAVSMAEQAPVAFAAGDFELAIALDRPALYQDYLEKPLAEFIREYWNEAGLGEHPLAKRKVTRLYVGSQFCHNLFPKREQLLAILEKVWQEGIAVTMVTTYLREESIRETEELFREVQAFGADKGLRYETVVNDWGMAALLRNMSFELSLGVLLNKRRKDTRMQYARDYVTNPEAVGANNLDQPFYRAFLQQKYGIVAFEWETCGPAFPLPAGTHHLHLPYYQTNTSQYCTLAARCLEGSRGAQRLITDCPGYCTEYACLYPDHLHTIGRGNSLFGYEERALSDASYLEGYLERGITRVVINLF